MSVPCIHVTTTDGSVYGVAAHTLLEAKTMVQERLTGEGNPAHPERAVRVARWDAAYGTVLWYTGPE